MYFAVRPRRYCFKSTRMIELKMVKIQILEVGVKIIL